MTNDPGPGYIRRNDLRLFVAWAGLYCARPIASEDVDDHGGN